MAAADGFVLVRVARRLGSVVAGYCAYWAALGTPVAPPRLYKTSSYQPAGVRSASSAMQEG